MKRLRGLLLLLTHLCFAHYSTSGQATTLPAEPPAAPPALPVDNVLPEQEAPAALFEGEIGDARVDFFLSGSWTATLTGSLGWLFGPGIGTVFPSAFPGFDSSQLFRQVPNLTVSVWLAERYFLEASVIGDFLGDNYDYFDENYLLMGYRAQEAGFLRNLYLGTRDIGIQPYPFLEVPEAGSSSLGATALLAGAYSSHELLLRYDNNQPQSYTFLGKNLLSEEVLQLDDYVRGRFFRLPEGGVTDLEVYIEDPVGDYVESVGSRERHYRRAALEDAVLDSTGGYVTLAEAATTAVVVYYVGAAGAVGNDLYSAANALAAETGGGQQLDPSSSIAFDYLTTYLGQPLSDRQVVIRPEGGGPATEKECLRLWRPGEFSPFEILGSYPLETPVPAELARIRVSIYPRGSDTALGTTVRFRTTPGADYVAAYRLPSSRDNLRNLYPFLDDPVLFSGEGIFDPDNLLYGPWADPASGYLRHELRVGHLTPVGEYRLGSDVVPGSVQVLRNGIAETRFEVDYATGVVEFQTPIGDGDRLEIRFRRRLALANNGDLLFAWGNTIPLGESHTLQVATGLRWNFIPGTYTTEAYSRTGAVLASVGLKGSLGPASYELSVAGAFTNPDTSGVMRLLGMEREGVEVPLSEDVAYPAAPPADDTRLGLGADSVQADNRGLQYYSGYPYESGSKIGPYEISGSSLGTGIGRTLVLDFDLAAGEWAGFQVPVASGGEPIDLSALDGVSLSYKTLDIGGTESFDLYLQIGALGEDLDDDGVLDRELSAAAAGFSFNDVNPSHAAILKVGTNADNQPNGELDSEDVDGNGFLDPEDSPTALSIVSLGIGSITAEEGWKLFQYPFSADEKAALRRVRSVRLLAVESGGSTAAARLLVDRIVLAGSRFWADPAGATVSARELEEWAVADPPPAELAETFPEVRDLFHPLAEEQKVLELEWSGGADWSVRGYTEAATEGIRYRSIVYYYRLPTAAMDGTLSFSLLDPAGKGVHWSLPAATSDPWREIRVDLDALEVYRNGSPLAGATVFEDPSYGSLSVFSVELSGSAVTTGRLYLDEVHLTDPRSALGAAVSLQVDLELPGTLWEVGGHPLLHDVSVRERAEMTTEGFASLYGIPADSPSFSSRSELDAGVSLADLSLTLDVVAQESGGALEASVGGSHRLTVPNVPFPLRVSDSYSYRQRDTGPALQRESSLLLDLAPLLQARFFATAGNVDDVLTQSWDALFGLTPGRFSFQNTLSIDLARSGFSVPREGYLGNWAWGYTLLWPTKEGAALERREALELDWQLLPKPLGLQLLGSLGLHSYELGGGAGAGRTQATRFAVDLGVPLVLGSTDTSPGRQLTVQPGYRRILELVTAESLPGDVPADFSSAFAALGGQRYAYTGIPFWELYDPALESSFLTDSQAVSQADFLAEPYLRVSRTFSSRLRDLFVPSYLEIGFSKTLQKDGDLSLLANHYNLQSRWRAVNLFGRLGAYSLFPAYRTDEYGTDLFLRVRTEAGEVQVEELRVENTLGFENGEAGALSLQNRLRITLDEVVEWSDGVYVLWDWFRYPEGGVALPLLPPEVGAEGFWAHQESLALKMGGPAASEEITSYHPFNLTVGHRTTLNLPDKGLVTLGGGLGLDLERTTAGQLYWRLGIEGSLEVKLEF